MDEKKVKEAIYCMKTLTDETVCKECDNYGICDNTMIADNARAAIEALEKYLPKKPITHKGTNRADCSVCGAVVRGIAKPFGDFCSKCGQRLDWSE